MRVICLGRFCDDLPGGIEAHVVSLLEALHDRVDFVHLVPSRDATGARFVKGGVPVVRTPSWNVDGSLALSPGLILEAWRQYRAAPCDLVHLHFPGPMSHLASMAIPAHVPRVITWHADITRQRRLLKLYEPWQDRILRQAAAIIVATPEHLRSSGPLSRNGISRKVRVIPYGFDLARFVRPHPATGAIRQRYPGRLIFAVGRHVHYKGFGVLLDAVSRLDQDVQLILGGEGLLTPSLKAQAQALGLGGRVHFPGLIPEEELPAYYQACDVFCLPSVTQAEAFGIVQIEAMAAGRPVVSSALGNGVDYVNQHGVTGLTPPPGDAPALADALASLLGDPGACQRMGAQARERVLREFSITAMADQTLDLYRSVLMGRVGPQSG